MCPTPPNDLFSDVTSCSMHMVIFGTRGFLWSLEPDVFGLSVVWTAELEPHCLSRRCYVQSVPALIIQNIQRKSTRPFVCPSVPSNQISKTTESVLNLCLNSGQGNYFKSGKYLLQKWWFFISNVFSLTVCVLYRFETVLLTCKMSAIHRTLLYMFML